MSAYARLGVPQDTPAKVLQAPADVVKPLWSPPTAPQAPAIHPATIAVHQQVEMRSRDMAARESHLNNMMQTLQAQTTAIHAASSGQASGPTLRLPGLKGSDW